MAAAIWQASDLAIWQAALQEFGATEARDDGWRGRQVSGATEARAAHETHEARAAHVIVATARHSSGKRSARHD